MGSKVIEIYNKIAYNVLSALYQPFWAAVLLAFLAMFLYLYAKEHEWKKNDFVRNIFATWWRAFRSSSNFRRTFVLAFYTAMILLRTVLNREISSRMSSKTTDALSRNSFFQLRRRFGWILFSVAIVFKSFSPLSSSITNSDLNLAEKFLLVRDIIIILLSVVFTVYQIH